MLIQRLIGVLASFACQCAAFHVSAQGKGMEAPKVEVTTAVVTGDVNGDGFIDVVTGNRDGPSRVYCNDGKGKMTEIECAALHTNVYDTRALAIGDVDGDGDLDLVEENAGGHSRLCTNDGKGVFIPAAADRFAIDGDVRALDLGDFDSDGDLDLFIARHGEVDLLMLNDKTGKFENAVGALPASAARIVAVASGDLDGDGDLDLVLAADRSRSKKLSGLRVYLNAGGKFTDVTTEWIEEREQAKPTFLFLADVNGDGKLDAFMGDARGKKGSRVRQFRNVDGRRFDRLHAARMPLYTTKSADGCLIDLDGDGQRDLVLIRGPGDGEIEMVAGPKGRFRAKKSGKRVHAIACRITRLAVADFDRDGRDDLLIGTAGGSDRLLLARERPKTSKESKAQPKATAEPAFHFEGSYLTPRFQDHAAQVARWRMDMWGMPVIDLHIMANGLYASRLTTRTRFRKQNPRSVRMIDGGLKWLAAVQDKDGRWDADGFAKHSKKPYENVGAGIPSVDIGITGLALMAFLAENNSVESGRYKEVVRKASQWLIGQQGEEGLIGSNANDHFIYDHAIATLALVELYALNTNPSLRAVGQKAIDYLESHRNPHACWRYEPHDNENDISVTGWCVMAYCAAHEAGLRVNVKALKIARGFMDEMTDPASGRTGYTRRGDTRALRYSEQQARQFTKQAEARTAVGLGCRLLLARALKDPREQEVVKLVADTVLARLPTGDREGYDLYYWMHGSLAVAGLGGKYAKRWQSSLDSVLRLKLEGRGPGQGSFKPDCVWGEFGGRVYSTAMAVLAYQARYRLNLTAPSSRHR